MTPLVPRDREGGLPEPAVAVGDTTSRTVPVIEESLEVDVVAVDQGGYRVVKRVATREETVDTLLQDERVEIERRPCRTPLPDGVVPQARQEGDTWILPVVEEVLVTVKQWVLVEEVRVTRVRGTHRASETVTLRKEEIDVERLSAEPASDPRRSQPACPPGAGPSGPPGQKEIK